MITVSPAYGRDYKTAEEAFTAWKGNKDFKIETPGYPGYINSADALRLGVPGDTIRIRYTKKTLLLVIRVNPDKDGGWEKELDTEELDT